jgi:ubiquinol-cytochrome c reductase cytochrome b subunit
MKILNQSLDLFKEMKWGEYSLLSLYISVLSGLLVAFQYNPATPFYSISTIDLLVPYGAYFRSLHFYSSQLFFLFCIFHFVAILDKATVLSKKLWITLTLSIPIVLLVLFSGYILRGDSTGFSAGMIAEAILLDIPVIGRSINGFLFSISDHGMTRVYVNHIIGFGLLWGWMVWGHIKKYRISFGQNLTLSTGILLFSVFVAAPFEPDRLGVSHIAGPWFFLGLQELLRHIPPLLAGILFPLTIIIALLFLKRKDSRYRAVLGFIAGWLFLYLVLTVISLNR